MSNDGFRDEKVNEHKSDGSSGPALIVMMMMLLLSVPGSGRTVGVRCRIFQQNNSDFKLRSINFMPHPDSAGALNRHFLCHLIF